LLAALASAILLYLLQYQGLQLPLIRPEWKLQNVLTFSYAGFVVWLFIWLFPQTSNNLLLNMVAELGQASYHIFLVQVVYFGMVANTAGWLEALLVCLPLGYLFYYLEKPVAAFIARSVTRSAQQ
jgi:hypothetical protein